MKTVYIKLIATGFALTLVVSIFSAIGVIFGLNDTGVIALQILAFALCSIVIAGYMRKKDASLKLFGFRKPKLTLTIILFSMAIILIQPLVLGFNRSLTPTFVGLILLQMVLVGFVEESLFRSVFFFFLQDNKKVYIVFSSIVFGLLHAASGINPEFPLVLVLLQVVNALLLGIILALLYLKTHSIYTTILLHTLFNLFASISNEDSLERTFLAVGVLLIVYVVFGFYLIKSNMKFLQTIKQG